MDDQIQLALVAGGLAIAGGLSTALVGYLAGGRERAHALAVMREQRRESRDEAVQAKRYDLYLDLLAALSDLHDAVGVASSGEADWTSIAPAAEAAHLVSHRVQLTASDGTYEALSNYLDAVTRASVQGLEGDVDAVAATMGEVAGLWTAIQIVMRDEMKDR